ncbi:hypothetical protein F2Q68_00017160 [Brassica cretica]|uniref:Replication factor A C-terminal domain-containing protein n=1 Tax=Brassica cretica TaxID=69181 RepID=A0A8S9H7G5_BRACR|nr:hypothetical protein F2Q68_00017160 [Brassica cretica]
MAMKPHGKSIVSSDYDEKVVFFNDLSLGHHEAQLQFRLIHFWGAWNPQKKTLIGMEMLLIDEKGTVIQGFVSPGRIEKYLPDMMRGSVYKLNNFYGSRNKAVFRVADHTVTVSFSWNSELSVLRDCPIPFDEDSFRFHSYEEFQAKCDLKGDLYDVVGHMKLVNGQSIVEAPVLDEVEIAKARRVMIHIQSHDGPVMKLYLWDQAARDFCKKFKSYESTPTVLLVTTVNTKTLGGTLALTSMSSSRVFMDYDVQPTIDYFSWLGSNPYISEQVNAEVVTKRETMTIGEIFSYIKQETAKLVNGQSIVEAPVLDEVEIAKARRVMIHIQSHDGPVMKLYLWDQAARDFCKKFKSYESTPTVLLVTTVNTKTLGGTLALTSMSSSRVFMDYDVQPTIDYFSWLGSNPYISEQVNAEVVTKRETMTIGEIFSYIKQETAKCTATIDDVVHGSAWYYIACSGCHSKVSKGPTSLICTNKKCGKVNVSSVAQYLSKISVYDNSEQAVFVLLGDAGRELTGKPASELVRSYFEANGNEGVNHEAPVLEALISTIGQRHKFCVKVTEHNFSGKTRSLTLTKILPLDTPPATESSEGNQTTAASEETSINHVDSAEGNKRT